MASAQVLPNSVASSSSSRKDHLEAGRRRLEEFRKKKAEGKVKKAAPVNQLQPADVCLDENLQQQRENMKFGNSDGAPFKVDVVAAIKPSESFLIQDGKANNSSMTTDLHSFNASSSKILALADDNDALYIDQDGRSASNIGFLRPGDSNHDPSMEEKKEEIVSSLGTGGENTYGIAIDNPIADDTDHGHPIIDGNIHQFSFASFHEAQSEENGHLSKEYPLNYTTESKFLTSSMFGKSATVPLPNELEYTGTTTPYNVTTSYDGIINSKGSLTESTHDAALYKDGDLTSGSSRVFEMEGKKLGGAIGYPFNAQNTSWRTPELLLSSSNQLPPRSPISDANTWRSRSSFLDSLNIPKGSLLQMSSESEKSEKLLPMKSLKVHSAESLASYATRQPFTETMEPLAKTLDLSSAGTHSNNSLATTSHEVDLSRQGFEDGSTERRHDFSSNQKDEDFAALEQHIEDLTQEKFSLRRALEASRALAESLATENSSLTDSFNQQGAVVNQLKADMERLQLEIRDRLVELEVLKMEYSNAQLECNAADERAKMLTSEVIGLEEKQAAAALRLRSNELKLERELEKSNAEITSYRRKVSTLEKERQDLVSTIDALKEEKKLMQSKLRKATAGKVIDTGKSKVVTKDESTSTEDLEDAIPDRLLDTVNNLQASGSSDPSANVSGLPFQQERRELDLSQASGVIPQDHLRMISNINSLISELSLEKEELMQALAVESSNSSKLKDLNKELSKKLEIQTQRLELLTAQYMANENAPARSAESNIVPESVVYADEGDEVVERVLGWIMKLFPGGPSKRRTSKLL
ncbi:hypothetical protein ACLOJK_016266 [Asimina triloba]